MYRESMCKVSDLSPWTALTNTLNYSYSAGTPETIVISSRTMV